MNKYQTNSQWRPFYKDNGPILFKSVKVIKVKERQRKNPRLKISIAVSRTLVWEMKTITIKNTIERINNMDVSHKEFYDCVEGAQRQCDMLAT